MKKKLLAIVLLLCSQAFAQGTNPGIPSSRHVVVIVLENFKYANIVGSVNAPYLNNTLIPQGALLTQFYSTIHGSMNNRNLMFGGLANNPNNYIPHCGGTGNGAEFTNTNIVYKLQQYGYNNNGGPGWKSYNSLLDAAGSQAIYVPNGVDVWVKQHAYAVGYATHPSPDNGHNYAVTVAGTSAATQPVWPTTAGATVTDGSVTWQEKSNALNAQYVKQHNGLTFFQDACDPAHINQSTTIASFPSDYQTVTGVRGSWGNQAPVFADIGLDTYHDLHYQADSWALDLGRLDAWLSANVPALLASPFFNGANPPDGGALPGINGCSSTGFCHDGQLWIVFDESNNGDNGRDNVPCAQAPPYGTGSFDFSAPGASCGGKVFAFAVGPQIKANYQSTTFHRTQDLLRTWSYSLPYAGNGPFPGDTNTAGTEILEIFVGH